MRNETAARLAYWREILDTIRSEPPSRYARYLYKSFSKKRAPALSKAANYFGLDIATRTDARILLRILASVIFETQEKNRPAGSKKWDAVRLFQLCIHHKLIEKENPRISGGKAAEEIKKRFPRHYQHDGPATIRQRLLAARALADKRRFFDDWFLVAIQRLTAGIEDKPGSQSAQQFRASADRYLKVMEGFEDSAPLAKNPRDAEVLAVAYGNLSATRNAVELEAWLREDESLRDAVSALIKPPSGIPSKAPSVGEIIRRFMS